MAFEKLHKVSCNNCRTRKIKCDRKLPQCSGCLKKEITCSYPQAFRNIPLISREKKISNVKEFKRGRTITKENYYYGTNSSDSLIKVIKGGIINEDEPSNLQDLSNIPYLVSDVAMNRKLIVNTLKTVTESAFFSIYEDMIDIGNLCEKIESCTGKLENSTVISICSLLMICSRFVDLIDEEKLKDLENTGMNLIQKSPACLEKIKAQILYLEYLYYNRKRNSAFQMLYSAVSGAYTLGIHLRNCKTWRILNFFDALICSTLGRPMAVFRYSMNQKEMAKISKLKFLDATIEIIKRSNNYILNDVEGSRYEDLVDLDIKYDLLITSITDELEKRVDQKELQQSLLVLLICNQLKLHFLFVMENKSSESKMMNLFRKYFDFFFTFVTELEVDISSKFNRYREGITTFHFKSHFTCLACFGNQITLILLVYLSSKKVNIPGLHALVKKTLAFIYRTDGLITYDPSTTDYLVKAVELFEKITTNDDLSFKLYNGDGYVELDIDNPFFFHSEDFLSLIYPHIE